MVDDAQRPVDDVHVRGVLIGGALIGAAIVGTLVVAWWMTAFRSNEGVAPPREPAGRPVLQRDPADDLAHYRTEQAAREDEYRWVDRRAGVVRIPVERALELTVAEHARAAQTGGHRDESTHR